MKEFPAPLKGRYQIRSELGTGGFSTIYLATDTKTGNDVSVKEFTADHMDGVGTVLRRNAFIVASQADPQPVRAFPEGGGDEKRTTPAPPEREHVVRHHSPSWQNRQGVYPSATASPFGMLT